MFTLRYIAGTAVLSATCIFAVGIAYKELRRPQAKANVKGTQTSNTALAGEEGIDSRGRLFLAQPPPQERAAVLALLSAPYAETELDFWSRVAAALHDAHVKVIVFCDAPACVASSRAHPLITIASYAEVSSLEALANDDIQGGCLLREEQWLFPKHIVWRTAETTPAMLAKEIRSRL